jgi:phosphoserine aminotransferase
VFKGETINTPSMLAVEDAILALEWAKGLRRPRKGLMARSNCQRTRPLDKIVAERAWLGHLAVEHGTPPRRPSVCLIREGAERGLHQGLRGPAREAGAAYDIAGYRDAPRPGCQDLGAGCDGRHPPTSRSSVRGSTGLGFAQVVTR